MQLINVTSWVIQNTYILARKCSWFDGFVVINGALDTQMRCGMRTVSAVCCQLLMHCVCRLCRDDSMVDVECHLCTLRHARPRFAAVGPMPQCALYT